MAGNDKALTGAEAGLVAPSPRGSLAGTVLLLTVAVFCLRQLVSFDVFWYLRAGDELLKRGVLLGTDPFSYTSTQPWVNHEWLAESAMALVYRAGGFAGLVGLQAVMVVAALALLLRQAWPHAGLEAWPAWLGLVCATATLGLSAEPRAQLFSWVLLAATLGLCFADLRRPSWRLLWVVPLGVLWANLHGGNPTGLAVLGALFLAQPTARRCAVLVGAALATLASPYGIHVHEHFLSAHQSLPEIREWHSLGSALALGSLPQWTASISALAAAGFLLIRARRGEVIRFELIMLVVFGAAAIAYARFSWELSLISAASLLRAPRARPFLRLPGALGLAVALLSLAGISAVSSRPLGFTIDSHRIPSRATRFLNERQPSGPMLNSYNFGGYLMWAYPREPVFIDSRAFMVYSEGHFQDLLRLYARPEFFRQLEQRWHFRLAVLQRAGRGASFLAWLRAQPDWLLAYEDDTAAVLVKR